MSEPTLLAKYISDAAPFRCRLEIPAANQFTMFGQGKTLYLLTQGNMPDVAGDFRCAVAIGRKAITQARHPNSTRRTIAEDVPSIDRWPQGRHDVGGALRAVKVVPQRAHQSITAAADVRERSDQP